jgi:hypothetical protein
MGPNDGREDMQGVGHIESRIPESPPSAADLIFDYSQEMAWSDSRRVEFILGRNHHLEALLRGSTFGARDLCPKGGRNHIFFVDPHTEDNEQYVYYLNTPWKLYYPTQLKNKLKKKGFQILDKPNGMSCELWDPLFSVKEMGVHRGSVEMHWPLNEEAPVRSWPAYDWATIQNILEETYPGVEIFTTVLGSFMLAVVLGFVSSFAYKLACRRFGRNDRAQDFWKQRRQWVKATHGAELGDVDRQGRPGVNC